MIFPYLPLAVFELNLLSGSEEKWLRIVKPKKNYLEGLLIHPEHLYGAKRNIL